MRKLFAFVLVALVISAFVVPEIFAARPGIPPHPTDGSGIGAFLVALFAALAAFLGGIFGSR